jgi:aminoglycoside phosphotransferase
MLRIVLHDPALPAAAHLVGPDAASLLDVAVTATGGRLLELQLVQVQHHPGRELVARHEALVSWNGGPPRRETLLTGCTRDGAPAGTLPLEADGIYAGAWRYPFDPLLVGLADAVTPGALDALVAPLIGAPALIDVVAYRPLRRAVVRATVGQRSVYIKVVAPRETRGVVDAHGRLRAAGLHVPEVLASDPSRGLLVLEALPGDSLRDVLVDPTRAWPPAADTVLVAEKVRAVPTVPDDHARQSAGLGPAVQHHARALLAVRPSARSALDAILPAVEALDHGPVAAQVLTHGDLYEAQLTVVDGRVDGVLDLDDVQAGHPLDDLANALAHLYLLRPRTRRHSDRLRRYRAALRRAATEHADPTDGRELDRRTGAALVGLAIGPYRAQSADWTRELDRRLTLSRRLIELAS